MQCGLREGMGELSNSDLRTSLRGRWIGIHLLMLEMDSIPVPGRSYMLQRSDMGPNS